MNKLDLVTLTGNSNQPVTTSKKIAEVFEKEWINLWLINEKMEQVGYEERIPVGIREVKAKAVDTE